MRIGLGLAAATAFILTALPAAAQDGACDRTCLQGVLDSYLSAVTSHDVAAAPLAAGYRATENAVATPAGEGLWKTAAGLGQVQRRFYDPVNGTAAYFGLINETGADGAVVPVITSLVIIVRDEKVAGAEWVYGRPGAPIYFPDGLIAAPPPEQVLPEAERPSRERLRTVADSYFEGIEKHDSNLVLNNKGCTRLENGTHMAGPAPENFPARGISAAVANAAAGSNGQTPIVTAAQARGEPADCGNGMEVMARTTQAVVGRHYPVLDEVAGVVVGGGIFVRLPGLTTPPRLLLTEYFYVRDGKISSIYAAMNYLPADAPSLTGWEESGVP